MNTFLHPFRMPNCSCSTFRWSATTGYYLSALRAEGLQSPIKANNRKPKFSLALFLLLRVLTRLQFADPVRNIPITDIDAIDLGKRADRTR